MDLLTLEVKRSQKGEFQVIKIDAICVNTRFQM